MQHLQTYGADADFFRRFSEDGHYGRGKGPYGTRQGYYAVTPSGKLLGSTNKRDPKIIAPMLRAALDAYAKLPREQRLISPKALGSARDAERPEAGLYPDHGLVLLEYVRDLPEPGAAPSTVTGNWNMDYVWLTRSEASALVPAHRVDAQREWPQDIAFRLARLHLIDTVNGLRFGQKPMFFPHDIKVARLVSRVESISGDRVELRFSGSTRAESARPRERGMRLELLGHGTWDRKARRFTAFELVALGRRWGGTGEGKSFDRRGEKGPMPIGFSFTLAGDSPAAHVPPMYLDAYGW